MKQINEIKKYIELKDFFSEILSGRSGIPKILLTDTTYTNHIIKREEDYIRLAQTGELYKIGKSTQLLGISKDKLENFFNNHSSKIRNFIPDPPVSMPIGVPICPFCERAFSGGMTIEHVLPKSDAVEYTITPVNLIVACGNCNTINHDTMGSCENTTEINLYFECFDITDNIDIVIENDSQFYGDMYPVVKFKKLQENNVLQNRLETFWNNYNLGNTYTKSAVKNYNKLVLRLIRDFQKARNQGSELDILLNLLSKYKTDSQELYEIDKRFSEFFFGYRLAEFFINNVDERNQLCSFICEKVRFN
jgi:hypothetical protein